MAEEAAEEPYGVADSRIPDCGLQFGLPALDGLGIHCAQALVCPLAFEMGPPGALVECLRARS